MDETLRFEIIGALAIAAGVLALFLFAWFSSWAGWQIARMWRGYRPWRKDTVAPSEPPMTLEQATGVAAPANSRVLEDHIVTAPLSSALKLRMQMAAAKDSIRQHEANARWHEQMAIQLRTRMQAGDLDPLEQEETDDDD